MQETDLILESEDNGWVQVWGNEVGREVVRHVFPDLPIDWGAPADMRGLVDAGFRAASLHIERMTRKSDVTRELPEITGAYGSPADRIVQRFGALLAANGAEVAIAGERDGEFCIQRINLTHVQ